MIKNIFSFLSIILLLSGGVYSCKKDDISGDKDNLIPGSYVTLKKSINGNLDFSNPAATVSMAAGSTGNAVQSINIYAVSGPDEADTASWTLIKNVAYADSVILTVSTAELAAALAPGVIEPGTQYKLQNEAVTTDGHKFSAFNTPTNFTSFPAYKFGFTWNATAVCAFDQAAAIGGYTVTYDEDWVDFAAGDPIAVSAGPDANSISFLAYPSVAAGGTNRKPWIIKVDPATGEATMDEQVVGDYSGAPNTKVSGSGFVFSCTGVITLNVEINYAGTIYNAKFELKHN